MGFVCSDFHTTRISITVTRQHPNLAALVATRMLTLRNHSYFIEGMCNILHLHLHPPPVVSLQRDPLLILLN